MSIRNHGNSPIVNCSTTYQEATVLLSRVQGSAADRHIRKRTTPPGIRRWCAERGNRKVKFKHGNGKPTRPRYPAMRFENLRRTYIGRWSPALDADMLWRRYLCGRTPGRRKLARAAHRREDIQKHHPCGSTPGRRKHARAARKGKSNKKP